MHNAVLHSAGDTGWLTIHYLYFVDENVHLHAFRDFEGKPEMGHVEGSGMDGWKKKTREEHFPIFEKRLVEGVYKP